jgi:hypothetical protein
MDGQAIDKLSGQPLYIIVTPAGDVLGNPEVAPHTGELGPYASGDRLVPLYGDVPAYDLVTQALEGPFYTVGNDRVQRRYRVRDKSAAELLEEICWWFGAVHSRRPEIAQ